MKTKTTNNQNAATTVAVATKRTALADFGPIYEKLGPDSVIIKIAKTNPRAEGSKAAANWGRYKPSMTLAQFSDAGGTLKQLRFDVRRGYVAVK